MSLSTLSEIYPLIKHISFTGVVVVSPAGATLQYLRTDKQGWALR